jgi:hypothetical protein
LLFTLLPLLTLLLCSRLCCVATSLPVASSAGAAPALLPKFVCFCTYAVVQ